MVAEYLIVLGLFFFFAGVFVAQKINNKVKNDFISLNTDGLVCNNPDQIFPQTSIKTTKCEKSGGDVLYCCGGAHISNGNGVDHCHKYDYATDAWTKLSNKWQHKVWGGAMITLSDGNIWYIGKILYYDK